MDALGCNDDNEAESSASEFSSHRLNSSRNICNMMGSLLSLGRHANTLSSESKQIKSSCAQSVLERAKYIPLRLTYEERKVLRTLEAALSISQYTDQMDTLQCVKNRTWRIRLQLQHIFGFMTGIVMASSYRAGQSLLDEKDFRDKEKFFQNILELGRRYKIMNPERMRGEYGKLMYLLQDAADPGIQELLGISLHRKIKTVYDVLEKGNAVQVLTDSKIEIATTVVSPEGKSRSQIQKLRRAKDAAVKEIVHKYIGESSLNEDTIYQCLYSIADNNYHLYFERDPIDRMIQLLHQHFSSQHKHSEEDTISLAIARGQEGARLSHSHQRQFHYVLQSLTLWREISHDMFRLWYLTDQDLLSGTNEKYQLTDTGQGVHRVQPAPLVSRAMHVILHETQRRLGLESWVGSSVIHLGDKNVPNALMFIDKYTQIGYILRPIVKTIDKLPELTTQYRNLQQYIDTTYGGIVQLQKQILADFFREAFDGSGGDNFFDAGSCIDGRMTSAWNWCSNLHRKPFFPVFQIAGFVGFDVHSIIHEKYERKCYEVPRLSKRQFSVFIALLSGILGALCYQIFYLDRSIPELSFMLPADSVRNLFEKMNAMDWSKRMRDDFFASFDLRPSAQQSGDTDRPGIQLAQNNTVGYSPIVMLPGFTSTGLEIWEGRECSRAYFRQRIWGTARMLQQFMMNQRCWLEHVMLNRSSGLDPNGVKLRPAAGLEAADYVIGGYWVWGKIIENLADIGYDTNSMFMASFDWRLAPFLLEKRDQYFTKLRYMIEMAKTSNGDRKVVIIAHSYASQVWLYFMKWVESDQGGKQGNRWIDQHIEAFISIAGSMLGATKSVSALLSGEMKDTAELGGLAKILGYFFGHPARASLARSWPSVSTMLPIGGNIVWGNSTYAPDDLTSRFATPASDSTGEEADRYGEHDRQSSHMKELNKKFNQEVYEHITRHGSNGLIVRFGADSGTSNITANELLELLGNVDEKLRYFHSQAKTSEVAANASDPKYDHPKYWSNPLAASLPYAPNMKLFCLYGIGKPVERAYLYKRAPRTIDESIQTSCDSESAAEECSRIVPHILDTEYMDPPWIKAGIHFVDGDGTVPLVSLGYMCARGWRPTEEEKARGWNLNPGSVDVRSREYIHNPVSLIKDPRGGPETSDHVDIMGNHALIRDVLHIVAKEYDKVSNHVLSEIHQIADRVRIPGS
ncbi:hypothetical protein ABG067_000133 [Albugo candida]